MADRRGGDGRTDRPDALSMNQISRITAPAEAHLWPGERPTFSRDCLDEFFAWAYRKDASDIRLQTHEPIRIQLHGRLLQVTRRTLTESEVEEAVNALYGADGQARLKQGEDFDVSYEVEPDRRTRMRFRVNATAVLSRGADGGAVVARALPNRVKPLAEQLVEPEIADACMPNEGLVLIAGGTGNGKSTLMAGMTRKMLEDPESNRAILEFSAPIEFIYDEIRGATAMISQSEVPRHIASFEAALRNGMRRAGDVIIIGECRDADTMSAAADAALTSHAVYSSIHAGTLSETIQRIVSLCPVNKRKALTVAIAQTLRLVVNQRLVPSTDGRRTALREFLVFNRPIRRRLAETDPDRWPNLIEQLLETEGQSFRTAAQRALEKGLVTEETVRTRMKDVFDVA
jgi:defect in organelle trafficking protein DotB